MTTSSFTELVDQYIAQQVAKIRSEVLVELEAAYGARIAALEKENEDQDEEIAELLERVDDLEKGGPGTSEPPKEPPVVDPPQEPPVNPEKPPVIVIPPTDTEGGIFYSVEELKARPTTGVPREAVHEMAAGSLDDPDLSDNDAQGDAQANAMAMDYAVTGDEGMKTKFLGHVHRLPNTDWERTLPASRGLPGYVAGMDVMKQIHPDLDDRFFRSFLVEALQKDLPGHSNFRSILASAFNQLNNWSGMARSSVISASLYLIRYGDAAQKALAQGWLDQAAKVHRVFLGDMPESQLGYKLDIDQTTWYPEWPPKDVTGVLKRGTIIKGFWLNTTTPMDIRGSGVIPTEALRTQGTSPKKRIGKPAYYPMPDLDQGYLWEGWNAAIPAAVALHRAGIVDFNAGDRAIIRGMEFLYGRGEAALNKGKDGKTWTVPATGDDVWILYYVDHYGKPDKSFANGQQEGSPGKAGIGHGKYLFGAS